MILQPVIDKLLDSISPLQACWLCIAITLGGGGYALHAFARNADVVELRVEWWQDRLLDLRIRQCDAVKEGRSAAFFALKIQELADQYQQLTGRRPDQPACGEL